MYDHMNNSVYNFLYVNCSVENARASSATFPGPACRATL
jgi:hypothetical protein